MFSQVPLSLSMGLACLCYPGIATFAGDFILCIVSEKGSLFLFMAQPSFW